MAIIICEKLNGNEQQNRNKSEVNFVEILVRRLIFELSVQLPIDGTGRFKLQSLTIASVEGGWSFHSPPLRPIFPSDLLDVHSIVSSWP